ncbi:carbonic anhydrase [Bosea sp. OK403]|jgi:carbonic anhydrase|uniref:carbonic anhydrase n=1 Tax=Bosea sp. OK403 TaxID=1855286 RepID=UPI0008F12391|nr:carbonic anhydrase [Bosea sp. OK403]SFJ05652.1 carbonic anhydrase [Bosea sp. OK403]
MDKPAPLFPERLTEGYRAFLDDRFDREKSRYEELADSGQTPKIMLIGCCDSRVSPEIIFDARPGEMFVARNVANLVPPFSPDDQLHGTSAALEYAVQALKVEHIVVLGHGRCGGIRAFADDTQGPLSPGDFIGRWITLIGPAAQRTGGRGRNESFEDYVERLSLASIQQSLINLRTFPCVQILEGKGRLQLHGAYFAVATGVLMLLDPATGQFVPAVGEMPKKVQMIRCDEPG